MSDTENTLVDPPVEDAPVEDAPVEDAPVEDVSVEDVSVEDAPAEDAPVEDVSVEDAPVEDASVEDASVEDVSVEDVLVEPQGPSLDVVVDNIKEMLNQDRSNATGLESRVLELESKLATVLQVLVDQKVYRYYNAEGWAKLDKINKGLDYQ